MQELIQKMATEAGISESQAVTALNVVKDFVKQQFPMMAGAVDKLFDAGNKKADDDFLD
jgi:hypothetical protein